VAQAGTGATGTLATALAGLTTTVRVTPTTTGTFDLTGALTVGGSATTAVPTAIPALAAIGTFALVDHGGLGWLEVDEVSGRLHGTPASFTRGADAVAVALQATTGAFFPVHATTSVKVRTFAYTYGVVVVTVASTDFGAHGVGTAVTQAGTGATGTLAVAVAAGPTTTIVVTGATFTTAGGTVTVGESPAAASVTATAAGAVPDLPSWETLVDCSVVGSVPGITAVAGNGTVSWDGVTTTPGTVAGKVADITLTFDTATGVGSSHDAGVTVTQPITGATGILTVPLAATTTTVVVATTDTFNLTDPVTVGGYATSAVPSSVSNMAPVVVHGHFQFLA
jgi:hypothetical protein